MAPPSTPPHSTPTRSPGCSPRPSPAGSARPSAHFRPKRRWLSTSSRPLARRDREPTVTAIRSTIPDTAVSEPPNDDLDSSPSQSNMRPLRLRRLAGVVLPPVGAVLVLLSFHHAADQAAPDQLQFAL